MSTTTTKRTPGRPKKSPAKTTAKAVTPPVVAPPKAEAPKKSEPLKYKEPERKNLGSVFVAPKAGIVRMVRQQDLTVFHEGKVKELRYFKNYNSCWAEDQGENGIKEAIVFRDGNLFVPPTKPNLIEFMRNHPDNMKNGGSGFYELEPSKKAEVNLEKEFDVVEAVSAVRDKTISELMPVAMLYGVSVNQKPSDIRYSLLQFAKKNPSDFMSSFDNPMVKARAVIQRAVDFQILSFRKDGVYWFDTGGLIVATPVGQDSLDVATRFCMTERGAPVLMEVEDRLSRLD